MLDRHLRLTRLVLLVTAARALFGFLVLVSCPAGPLLVLLFTHGFEVLLSLLLLLLLLALLFFVGLSRRHQ